MRRKKPVDIEDLIRTAIGLPPGAAIPLDIQPDVFRILNAARRPSSIKVEVTEESKFERDWEVSDMGRNWGGVDAQVAKVWLDEGEGVLCARFPYKKEVIDDFHRKIPKGKKAWDGDKKVWKFSTEVIEVLINIFQTHFGIENVIDMTSATAPTVEVKSGDPLLSLLDKEDIQKIYILLVRKYHPDVGGDNKKMAAINQIFNKIR